MILHRTSYNAKFYHDPGLRMKELLYFSSSDLMVQVDYKEEVNSISYHSHRELSFGERVVVEQYLLTNIAVKTDYYKKYPAMLGYSGVDSKLVKELNQFHIKNTMNDAKRKKSAVNDSVQNLIDRSLSNYYFEQIGNTLLELRKASQNDDTTSQIKSFATKLKELVSAYNSHNAQCVDIDEIVPTDLRSFLD